MKKRPKNKKLKKLHKKEWKILTDGVAADLAQDRNDEIVDQTVGQGEAMIGTIDLILIGTEMMIEDGREIEMVEEVKETETAAAETVGEMAEIVIEIVTVNVIVIATGTHPKMAVMIGSVKEIESENEKEIETETDMKEIGTKIVKEKESGPIGMNVEL